MALTLIPKVLKAATLITMAILFLVVPLPISKTAPAERYFRIEASQFAYSPGTLRVNPGDRVTIDLVATDVVHGIYIDSYNIKAGADPGQTTRLTFTADRPGLFRFRCLVPCGQLHPFMIGKLQVGSNGLFLRAAFLAAFGLGITYLWKKPLHSATT